LRVLIASKILVVAAYRRKLDEIAALPEIERLIVVTPPAWREPGGRLLTLEPAPASNYELRVEPIRFNGSFHLFHWPNLGRVMRATRPDLVHLDEEPYNLATAMGVRAAQKIGARIVFFTWQNLLRRYPPPFNLFEQLAFRASSYAIAGNSEAVDVLRAKGYRGPTSIIPQFGVDPELFSPGPAPDGPLTIGFIARLVEEKGILVLLDALRGLRGDWRLHVVGSGPLKRRAEQRAAALGLAERISWEPGVASTQIPLRLRQFSMLVQPSLTRRNWKEQFGRAVMEAMACGVPVVGSDSGEIPHVVGNAGLVVREADPLALRAALARLLDDPALRAELGRRGRARVLDCFTNQRIAEKTVRVYRAARGADVNTPDATIV
jgi:glycosyltransferase involved in cell wall biosynthesis